MDFLNTFDHIINPSPPPLYSFCGFLVLRCVLVYITITLRVYITVYVVTQGQGAHVHVRQRGIGILYRAGEEPF